MHPCNSSSIIHWHDILYPRIICYCFLDLLLNTHGCYSWKNGSVGDTVPGLGQHLQQCHHQHTQGRGSHCYWSLDVGLYPLCIWSSSRVSFHIFLPQLLKNNLDMQHCYWRNKDMCLDNTKSTWRLFAKKTTDTKFKRNLQQTKQSLFSSWMRNIGGRIFNAKSF